PAQVRRVTLPYGAAAGHARDESRHREAYDCAARCLVVDDLVLRLVDRSEASEMAALPVIEMHHTGHRTVHPVHHDHRVHHAEAERRDAGGDDGVELEAGSARPESLDPSQEVADVEVPPRINRHGSGMIQVTRPASGPADAPQIPPPGIDDSNHRVAVVEHQDSPIRSSTDGIHSAEYFVRRPVEGAKSQHPG